MGSEAAPIPIVGRIADPRAALTPRAHRRRSAAMANASSLRSLPKRARPTAATSHFFKVGPTTLYFVGETRQSFVPNGALVATEPTATCRYSHCLCCAPQFATQP